MSTEKTINTSALSEGEGGRWESQCPPWSTT